MNPGHPGGDQGIENQMFPQDATVFGPQVIPAARMTYQSRVESLNLGLRDDLATAAG